MNDNIISYVLAAGNGDTDAMAKLYSMTLKGTFFLASKLCDTEADAVDVTRKAYAKAFCSIDKLKKPEAFEIWMKQMVSTYYKDSCKFVFTDADGGALEPDCDFLPEAILTNEEDAAKVVSAIATLSPERRTALVLYYNNGMPVAVLSRFLGVSESTANAILCKARNEVVAKSGIKAPDYPELSTLPVLTRLFQKLASEMAIEPSIVRDMFIFIVDAVDAAKPSEPVADEEIPVTVLDEDAPEAEAEETAEEAAEEAEETEAEAEEEQADEPAEVADEEAEEIEEAAEEVAEEETEAEPETTEETVDKIEENLVSFKDRISEIIGEDEPEAEADGEIEETFELDETVPAEVAEPVVIAEEPEAAEDVSDDMTVKESDEDILDAIKRSMDDLNEFAENGEVVEFNEDTGAISFALQKTEPEFKPEEPAMTPADEKNEADKFEGKKKSKVDKKVIVIVIAVVVLIAAIVAVVLGLSSKKDGDGEEAKTTSPAFAEISSEWKPYAEFDAYDSISYLNEHFAVFTKGGKCGLLDNAGNVVLNADYDSFKMCSDGKDYNSEGDYHIIAVYNGKEYNVDVLNGVPTVTNEVHVAHETDTTLTPDGEGYVDRDRYHGGFAAVENAEGKWGYIKQDGTLVIDFKYDAVNADSYAADSCLAFDCGYVAVKKDGKMGIVDMNDNTVVEFEYDLILQGDNGVYLAQKGDEWGLLLVGDAAINEYVDHQVITAAPESNVPGNDLGEPVGTYVAHGDANVRNAPSSDADKIGTIPEDGSVVVYEIVESQNEDDNSDFAKIEFEGQIGYVSMGLLDEE